MRWTEHLFKPERLYGEEACKLREYTQEWVDFFREQFPIGSRIKIRQTADVCPQMAPEETGQLERIDDNGRFIVSLKNSVELALILGEDRFSVILPESRLLNLYMPMSVTCYEKDDWGDEMDEEVTLSDREAVALADTIAGALRREELPEETTRGLMRYFDSDEAVNSKVQAYRFTAEARGGRLWGVAKCMVTGDLTPKELEILKEDITGQASDGFGEGFEQRPIGDGGRSLYVHLWSPDSWSIQTEQEQFGPETAEGLPELCYSILQTTGQLIRIKRGETGYSLSEWSTGDKAWNVELADELNEKLGVTPIQRQAMEVGSLAGWDAPGADPKCYEAPDADQTSGVQLG